MSDDRTYGIGRVAEEDLAAGQFVAVFNLKRRPHEPSPIMGQALEIKAVCLPYVVVKIVSDPSEPTVTFDLRFLNLMRVTKDYVDAQREGAKAMVEQEPSMNMKPQRQRRKEG